MFVSSFARPQFRMYACEAYNILRKRADLILSLFHLMAGASIEAIRADPEKAILKLQVGAVVLAFQAGVLLPLLQRGRVLL